MKNDKQIKVCGSITKYESLLTVKYNILKHTCVAEANSPYPNYYGRTPEEAHPNSIFLFTSIHYSLEDVLRFAQNIDECYMEKVNIASAHLTIGNHKYDAIRIKHFPDYEHLHMLQSCCINEGVEFARKVAIKDKALVRVNKCFSLEKKGDGIYFDLTEDHKGYITIPSPVSDDDLEAILLKLRNNTNCKIFDAEPGALIIDSKAKDIIRIYAENLDVGMLTCIQEKFASYLMQLEYEHIA